MKNLEKLISRTAECRRVFAGKRDLDYVAVNHSEAMIIKAEVDARIAELTAEVVRLHGLVKEAYEEGVSDTDAAEEGRWYESHARNALKDGK